MQGNYPRQVHQANPPKESVFSPGHALKMVDIGRQPGPLPNAPRLFYDVRPALEIPGHKGRVGTRTNLSQSQPSHSGPLLRVIRIRASRVAFNLTRPGDSIERPRQCLAPRRRSLGAGQGIIPYYYRVRRQRSLIKRTFWPKITFLSFFP
jgi:hypothetical protein